MSLKGKEPSHAEGKGETSEWLLQEPRWKKWVHGLGWQPWRWKGVDGFSNILKVELT